MFNSYLVPWMDLMKLLSSQNSKKDCISLHLPKDCYSVQGLLTKCLNWCIGSKCREMSSKIFIYIVFDIKYNKLNSYRSVFCCNYDSKKQRKQEEGRQFNIYFCLNKFKAFIHDDSNCWFLYKTHLSYTQNSTLKSLLITSLTIADTFFLLLIPSRPLGPSQYSWPLVDSLKEVSSPSTSQPSNIPMGCVLPGPILHPL